MSAGAFVYLTARSAANRLARQAAELRNPRYLVALLLGLGYLGYVFLRGHPPRDDAVGDRWIEPIGVLVLLVLIAWSWIVGVEQRALAFSPAEVTLLFPAPITRRALVHYKLLRSQLVILLNTLLWTVLLRRGTGPMSPLLRAIAVWVLLSTLSLHRLGASFVRTSLAGHGWAGVRRRLPSLAVVTLVAGGLVWTAIDAVPALRAAREAGGAALLDAVAAVLAGPVLGLLLWPLRVLVRPLAATTPAAWLAAMGPALLVLAAHYLWVIRSDTAFEEAAAEASLAQARRRSAPGASGTTAVRRGGPISAPLVALQPTGWPASAIFWKNVTAVLRRRRAGRYALAFVVASGLAAAGSFGAQRGIAEFAAVLAITWFGFVFALGPQWIRNDLRSDLLQVDLLRAYPVPGWAIVLVETLASTLVLTALELAMLVFAYCALLGNTGFDVPPDERALLLAAAFVLLPPITFSAMLLQNGAALLYPAWVRLGMAQRGVEALGQNLLATAAFALILAVLFAGPGLAGWLVYTGLAPGAGNWALAPALLFGFVLLAAELALLIRWLGRVFERTDAASVPVAT